MNLISSLHRVTDYCARYPEWLQVSLSDDKVGQGELVEKLARLKREAAANKIKKIELSLSKTEAEKYSTALEQAGFQSGLVCLQTKLEKLEPMLQKRTKSSSQPSSVPASIAINSISSHHLTDLLHQQAEYHFQVKPDYYLAPDKIDWPTYLAALEQDRQREYCYQLVALINDKPVGLILAETNPEQKQLNVFDVIVDETCRAQGVGKKLFASLSQLGFDRTIIIELETYEQMPARRWYQRMGFAEKGRGYYWVK